MFSRSVRHIDELPLNGLVWGRNWTVSLSAGSQRQPRNYNHDVARTGFHVNEGGLAQRPVSRRRIAPW